MNNKEVLVVEISGKRPGTAKERPTEKYFCDFDHLIISNNSEGYKTDWNIINVPKDYEEFYKKNYMIDEKAYYAPMNRSYAIKYAKEHGYKYLVQLDDNINGLVIQYRYKKTYYRSKYNYDMNTILYDFIKVLVLALECTNAGISGFSLVGASAPKPQYLTEAYVYSFFCLKLDVIPDYYQGGFEDDIEFRFKLKQLGIPSVQIGSFCYQKVQTLQKQRDLTGCRLAYKEVGILRGENMRKLYGDIYSAGLSNLGNAVGRRKPKNETYFKHKIKAFKVGIRYNEEKKKQLDEFVKMLFKKYVKKIVKSEIK